MGRDPGADHDLAEVIGEGRQVLGPGRYETLHLTGEIEGRPVLTFSVDEPPEHGPEGAGDDHDAPAPAYLATMARGLRRVHGLADDAIADYLLGAGGISHDRAAVLDAIG